MPGKIANPALAEEGQRSYEWARQHMATLTRTIDKQRSRSPLSGLRLALCLHVTKETSVLARGLQALGGQVALAGANPLSTQDHIAAFMASEGATVFAWRGESPAEYSECIRSILRTQPQIIMDDGGDAHVMLHSETEFATLKLRGGTEETTTGVTRLRALVDEGRLRYPVIAVNNAYTKFLFDNRYGTGQSTFDGLLRATSLLIAGKTLVVCGYGWVGRGVAQRARGLGAAVVVTEVDPFRALEARMDGFDVRPIAEAAPLGDIFVTCTGQTGVIRMDHIRNMKDGTVLANAGHFDVEIDVRALDASGARKQLVRPNVEEYLLPSGHRVYLIGRGRIANLVAAEGHPPEVMALSFTNQLLAAVHVAEHSQELEPRVHPMPRHLDEEVARNALAALDIRIDTPTPEQKEYAKSWAV